MSDIRNNSKEWTSAQAYILAVICLLIGVVGGWLFRGSQSPSSPALVENASASAPAGMGSQPTPAQMKRMADTQAAPLVEKLKSDPNNAELLANVGNIYYDTEQYPTAIDYYQRSLKAQPANTGVRTDMATAYWYIGDADTAISEFNKALSYEPNKANTLFNLGVVEWQGKMDVNGAVAVWEKLLATNPNYEGKDKVLQLIAQAKKHSNVKPGTPAKPLSE
ncbi:MAG TPA: tetratricopeptide repeat protein [Terriglobales bacterium]|jgi:cytochrome c-type biogenesis protein CcmH/NrfG|nr:tetratricopeptide repeat protein [Terriglobales bacterium]